MTWSCGIEVNSSATYYNIHRGTFPSEPQFDNTSQICKLNYDNYSLLKVLCPVPLASCSHGIFRSFTLFQEFDRNMENVSISSITYGGLRSEKLLVKRERNVSAFSRPQMCIVFLETIDTISCFVWNITSEMENIYIWKRAVIALAIQYPGHISLIISNRAC